MPAALDPQLKKRATELLKKGKTIREVLYVLNGLGKRGRRPKPVISLGTVQRLGAKLHPASSKKRGAMIIAAREKNAAREERAAHAAGKKKAKKAKAKAQTKLTVETKKLIKTLKRQHKPASKILQENAPKPKTKKVKKEGKPKVESSSKEESASSAGAKSTTATSVNTPAQPVAGNLSEPHHNHGCDVSCAGTKTDPASPGNVIPQEPSSS